jgi:cytochrome c556
MNLRLLACFLAAALIGCDTAPETPETPAPAEPVSAASAEREAADHAHGAADSDLEPLPLLAIMQKLGTDMTALTHALMTDDFDGVTSAAAAMADHAPIAQHDVERISTVLGAEMHAFEELDEEVHTASLRLHDAARGRDTNAILTQLHEVQTGCVACHQRFRERLLSAQER